MPPTTGPDLADDQLADPSDDPGAAPGLRDLRMTDQLFLWTVRHVVCAAEDGTPIDPRIEQFYRDAGLPRVIALTVALLRTLSAVATGPMTVNVPCGVQILEDESALLRDLYRNSGQTVGLRALRRRVLASASASVARRLHDLARQFAALDAMRGGPQRAERARVH